MLPPQLEHRSFWIQRHVDFADGSRGVSIAKKDEVLNKDLRFGLVLMVQATSVSLWVLLLWVKGQTQKTCGSWHATMVIGCKTRWSREDIVSPARSLLTCARRQSRTAAIESAKALT